METVGRLAGGVAHDFNNLLTIITGYSEMVMMKLSPGEPMFSDMQEIKKASERASQLTRQLLAFSRRQLTEPKSFHLNDVLLEIDRMLRRLIGEDIELVTIPAENLGRIKIDPGQLEQVIVNLSVNARDAMPEGGKLTFETANVTFDEVSVSRRRGIQPGDYVMLAVSDTGQGMSEEVLEHIFEPFFTTKDSGQGTGLGLATCYGIIKQNGGSIQISSEPGRGTTIKLYLPRTEEEGGPVPMPDEPGELPLGTETVLFVEDEISLRAIAARFLRKQGYQVLEATNGDEALRMVADLVGEREIHLLLTDVVMPGMGGKELAKQLQAKHPDLKVLFISGYPGEAISSLGVLDSGVAFLRKPFTPGRLAGKVRKLLDG
jgi:CheY-like chemotaxis protein